MADRCEAERDELFRRMLSLAAQNAQTPVTVAEQLGVPLETVRSCWRHLDEWRRCQGTSIAECDEPLSADALFGAAPCLRGWYSPTWRMNELLEEFQRNEGLAAHYVSILSEPEGGHFILNLAAAEVVRLLRFEYAPLDEERLFNVCVAVCEPHGAVERLVSNTASVLQDISDYRTRPLSPELLERLYADLTDGVALQDAQDSTRAGSAVRAQFLASLCHMLARGGGQAAQTAACPAPRRHNALVGALIAWCAVSMARPFPVANEVFGYVLYFLLAHRAGYHISSHVPLTRALGINEGTARTAGIFRTALPLLAECDGFYDWTAFLEHALRHLVEEQRYIVDKLDGMARRRERFRSIICADVTMNSRQQDVFLEAMLHSNAEFSYAVHEKRYGVSYLCARSDLARFLELGLLTCCDDGIRHFFIASEDFNDKAWSYLKSRCPEAYARFYGEDGTLRDEHRAAGHAVDAFNDAAEFYERAILDGIWLDHYAHRRLPIAREDGLRRREASGIEGSPP